MKGWLRDVVLCDVGCVMQCHVIQRGGMECCLM